jgi:hypothetical protein
LRRPDCAGLHLFHDLSNFRGVSGHGYGPMRLGTANIDHVVLSGAQWLLVDAKGMGAGTLTLDARGYGVLIRPDGTVQPQEWLDSGKTRAAAGVLFRLTGLRGWPVWVLPDATTLGTRITEARAFEAGGGTITQMSDIYSGSLDDVLPVPQPPADLDAVATLDRYVTAWPR